MKKTLALLACMLVWAVGGSAQTVSFSALPATNHPTLLPNGYGNLDWANFSYVDPLWSGAGLGFKQGPNALDVAFMGGGVCELTEVSCSASISSHASNASSVAGFRAQSAIVAAGYHAESVVVLAYNNGQFVGMQNYDLTTSLQQINFPGSWGAITQLVMDTTKGTVVLYAFKMQSASAQAEADVRGSPPNAINPGPVAPLPVLDPLARVAAESADVGSTAPKAGPNAPKNSPVALESETGGGPIGPPIQYPGPSAPKGVGSITQYSEAGGGPIGPPIQKVGPNSPKSGPISQYSETGGGPIGPPIAKCGRIACKNPPITAPKDVAHASE